MSRSKYNTDMSDKVGNDVGLVTTRSIMVFSLLFTLHLETSDNENYKALF
jgi:hypothetical protein